MSIDLDLSLAGTGTVGAHSGLGRGDIAGLGARIAAVHDEVVAATAEGLLPHVAMARAPATPWEKLGTGWARGRWKADRVIVLGESAAVGAVMAFQATAGDRRVVAVPGPDTATVRAALDGASRARLLVLDGPPWVRTLALGLAPSVAGVTVVSGDGLRDDGWTIEGADRIASPGAADPRFAAFGPASLALCAYVGLDAQAIRGAVAEVAERCADRALLQNPAYRLGAALHLAATKLGRPAPAMLVPAVGTPVGEWALQAWNSITARRDAGVGGPVAIRGATPMCAIHGDESAIQRLVGGPPTMVVVALLGAEPDDIALGEATSVGALAAELLDAQLRFLVGQGQPVIRMRLTRLDPPNLAAAAWVLLHGMLTVAALSDGDPLSMESADLWRSLLLARVDDPHARW